MKTLKIFLFSCAFLIAQVQLSADTNASQEKDVTALAQVYPADLLGPLPMHELKHIALTEAEIETKMFIGLTVNLFIGFGIGSFIQEDLLGGTVGLVFDIAGVGFILYNMFELMSFQVSQVSPPAIYYGMVILILSKIYQLVAPVLYANVQKNKLSASLFHKNKNVNFMLAPQVTYNMANQAYEIDGIMLGTMMRF